MGEGPEDELKERRAQKQVGEAMADIVQTAAEAMKSQKAMQDFQIWLRDNMQHHAEHAQEMAASFLGVMGGTLVGHWFDCGVRPDLLKEYFSRFIDVLWVQYEATRKAMGREPTT